MYTSLFGNIQWWWWLVNVDTMSHLSISALMEAQDIFGLDFDFDEFEKYGRDDFLSEEDEDEYEEEDEEDGALRRPKKKSTKKSIYEVSICLTDSVCIAGYDESNIDAVQ